MSTTVGVDAAGVPVFLRKLTRKAMMAFSEKLEPTVIAIEARDARQHWALLLGSFGHTMKLIPPQLGKRYAWRGKK